MAKKEYNQEAHNKAHGRREKQDPDKNSVNRERNIGHKDSEEHSRKHKGGDRSHNKK